MPDTPCAANASGTYPCQLTGLEQLRYLSLSLGYNLSGGNNFVDDPDGLNGAAAGPVSLISLSDAAFATVTSNGNKYVNLLVNVDPTNTAFSSFVNNNSPVPAFQGVTPRGNANGMAYAAQQLGNGYTAVDLTTLQYFSQWYTGGSYQGALQLVLRNTLLGNGFNQSGLAVPFSTTQYLGGGLGIMGPYVPMVSYVPIPPPPVSLPTFPAVGQPTGTPSTNVGEITPPKVVQNYPEQYWPSSPVTGPEKLVCGTNPPAPLINFVGTQFSIPVDNTNISGSPKNCNLRANLNNCSQIFAQTPQANGNASENWQPGVPLTIEGSGFGTLPVINLPYATTGWGSTAYLTVKDTPAGQPSWTSPNSNCQMYIQKWSDTSITVVPNVETGNTNGMGTVLSLLTETNPLSLIASTSCPVNAKDSIQVTVINPQTGTSASLPQPITVGTFTGSLN